MTLLKKLLNSTWCFPLLVFYYGILYIVFGEPYPLNGGMSMDGIVFSSFIPEVKNSFFFDTYYVHRIFPSVFVGLFFKILAVSITDAHIFIAFQILNLVCLTITCYFFKQLLLLLKISLKNQLLAFTLFLINFALLKFPYYLPVMTDNVALTLSTMLLFFYIKKNIIGVIVCTFLACYTWQLSFYQGLIFIIIPFSTLPFKELKPVFKITLRSLSGLMACCICIYLILIKNMDTSLELVARINKPLLPVSIGAVTIIYFFFSNIFLNANLFNFRSFFKTLKPINIIIAILLVVATVSIVYVLNPVPNKFYPFLYTLSNPFTHALMWPFHSIVSHTAFWGMVVILLLFFWAEFCKIISQMGWGIVLAFALNIYSFGIMPETRCLVNLLPWVVLFLIKAINKYSFNNLFYFVIAVFSLITSKIWLTLNEHGIGYDMHLDKNGSMGFPDQRMWMNFGPWMSEQMYYIQAGSILLLSLIIFFLLYKIEKGTAYKIQLIKRFKTK